MAFSNTPDNNPYRRPDATWTIAGEIVRGRAKPPGNDDKALRVAIAIRRHLGGDPEANPGEAAQEAHEIYRDNGLKRAELESRLAAGQSDMEIARLCDVTPQAVKIYERIFLRIRAKLTATNYMLHHLVWHAQHSGFRNRQVREFWTWLAIVEDSLLLDFFIALYRKHLRPGKPPKLEVYLRREVPLNVKALVARYVIRSDRRGDEIQIIIHQRLQAIDTIRDPAVQQYEMERLQRDVVRCGRKHLTGKKITDAEIDKMGARVDRICGMNPRLLARKPSTVSGDFDTSHLADLLPDTLNTACCGTPV